MGERNHSSGEVGETLRQVPNNYRRTAGLTFSSSQQGTTGFIIPSCLWLIKGQSWLCDFVYVWMSIQRTRVEQRCYSLSPDTRYSPCTRTPSHSHTHTFSCCFTAQSSTLCHLIVKIFRFCFCSDAVQSCWKGHMVLSPLWSWGDGLLALYRKIINLFYFLHFLHNSAHTLSNVSTLG